jgi:hypothetical protein
MRLPQRLLAFFLSFALIFSSTSALATTSVGGWTATDSLIAGANTTINAAKTAGGKALKSSITVAASASKVGKHLIKGGGAAALAFAMVELLDAGIDWVLDPANNAVKYKDPNASEGGAVGTGGATDQCIAAALSTYGTIEGAGFVEFHPSGGSMKCKSKFGEFGWIPYNPPAGSGSGSDEYKYIPIDTVAAKVISNAEAGHAPSQEAVKATALEGFAAGEHDAALDAAAVPDTGVENPTEGVENPTDPNPTDPPKDPAVPFDPSSIIAAINALKALLAGILSSITSLADWFKADPEEKDNEVDIPDVPLPEPNTDISFGGSCPADLSVNFNLYGTSTDFVLMPFSKFCPLLSTFVKPTLIVLGSFFAVSIVGGRRDE